MSMNSFSFRADLQNRQAYEEEISGLLELHQDGEVFPLDPSKNPKNLNYKPLDFSSLREEWEDPRGQRMAPRYELQMTVLIANHLKAFRTLSQNLSLTGLLLKDLLPTEFAEKVFDVVLIKTDASNKKTFFLFRGKAVGRSTRSRRVKFEAMAPDSEAKLRKLFQGLRPTG
jgi:hypothetical protein